MTHRGDLHHIFPRDFLKKSGLPKSRYNQVANYAYMQSEINIRLGNRPPREYMAEVRAQCEGGPLKYGGITSLETLRACWPLRPSAPGSRAEKSRKPHDTGR